MLLHFLEQWNCAPGLWLQHVPLCYNTGYLFSEKDSLETIFGVALLMLFFGVVRRCFSPDGLWSGRRDCGELLEKITSFQHFLAAGTSHQGRNEKKKHGGWKIQRKTCSPGGTDGRLLFSDGATRGSGDRCFSEPGCQLIFRRFQMSSQTQLTPSERKMTTDLSINNTSSEWLRGAVS